MSSDLSAVRQLWPLLFVRDIRQSVDFYTDRLGFDVVGKAEGEDGMFWCRLERGGACLMLQQGSPDDDSSGPPAPSVTFYFICEDVDAVFAECSDRGLSLDPPTVAYYGMKQLFVPDPDGYGLCFETPMEGWSG